MSALILLITLHLLPTTSAAECSSSCSDEFVTKCMPFNGGNTQDAYNTCRDQLCSGKPPIANKCTDKTCTDTTAMAAKDLSGNYECTATTPTNPGGGTNGGGNGGTPSSTMCTQTISGAPSTPTLCTATDSDVLVYTFYPHTGTIASTARYFSVVNLPSTAPATKQPVVLFSSGYGGDKRANAFGEDATAAKYYKFTLIQMTSSMNDGAGGFSLQFGNDGVANDNYPTPCADNDSRDIVYLTTIFDWISAQEQLKKLDSTKVFTKGFSQNSMFAVYTAVCFADKVAGVWQGGSGLAKTAFSPIVPGAQAQCTLSHALADGGTSQCCKQHFCTECKYWPLYPQTCASTKPERKIVDCLMTYTNDRISCGSDMYMYEAMVREGNDARMLSFAPSTGVDGGHSNPQNAWAWVAGCLGLSEACSITCEQSFSACTGSDVSPSSFATCETNLKSGTLNGCDVGCSPTLGMLQRSEAPVISLSEGNFGRKKSVTSPTGGTPIKPNCDNKFGSFNTVSTNCQPPSGTIFPDASKYPIGVNELCDGNRGKGGDNPPSATPSDVPAVTPVDSMGVLHAKGIASLSVVFVLGFWLGVVY